MVDAGGAVEDHETAAVDGRAGDLGGTAAEGGLAHAEDQGHDAQQSPDDMGGGVGDLLADGIDRQAPVPELGSFEHGFYLLDFVATGYHTPAKNALHNGRRGGNGWSMGHSTACRVGFYGHSAQKESR